MPSESFFMEEHRDQPGTGGMIGRYAPERPPHSVAPSLGHRAVIVVASFHLMRWGCGEAARNRKHRILEGTQKRVPGPPNIPREACQ